MRVQLLILVFLAWGVPAATAQVPGPQGPAPARAGGEVQGRVVDAETGEPIVGASVAVRAVADSAIVSGAIIRGDGGFRVPGLPPGRYWLHVTSIGYQAHRSAALALSPDSPTAAVGTIELARAPVAMEGIDVTVERPPMVVEPDRNSYRARDVAPAAANATDILEAVPSVQVDVDGKVSLRGNENVAIQINGRPAPMRGDQLTAYLRQLPAASIERIEVVPTPSARYDPEGMAGIINIVTKQNTDLGWSGGVNASGSTAERYNAGGNIGYQRGPLTLLSSYGFSDDQRETTGFTGRERLGSSSGVVFTDQLLSGDDHSRGHNVSTNADLRMSPRDVLSGSLTLSRRTSDEESVTSYLERDATGGVLDRYERLRDSDSERLLFDTTLAFKRTFEPRRHELSTELRFNRNSDDDRIDMWREPAAGNGDTRTDIEEQNTDALTRELTGQVDYTRPLGASTKLESGYKGSSRWLERDYVVLKDPLGTGDVVESDISNAFDFDEQVHAVYGVASRVAGKFELQGGLRAEYATRDFTLADAAGSFPYDYTSLFPSGVLAWNRSDDTQLKLSYSRRIRRPRSQELNPFPQFMDVQNVFVGNPRLNPEYTDAIELGFTNSGELGTLQISPFYRRTTDVIRFIVDTDDVIDGREVTSVSFENLATGTSWGTDVNGQFKLGKWLSGIASFNVFKMVTEGGSETSLSSNAVGWSARLNATAQVTPTTSLQAMQFYRAPMDMERGRFGSWKMTSLTLRQRLLDDKASLSLRVIDPFDVMGFNVRAANDNLSQITERSFNARALQLTFQYSFGQAPRVRQTRPAEPAPDTQPAGFPQ